MILFLTQKQCRLKSPPYSKRHSRKIDTSKYNVTLAITGPLRTCVKKWVKNLSIKNASFVSYVYLASLSISAFFYELLTQRSKCWQRWQSSNIPFLRLKHNSLPFLSPAIEWNSLNSSICNSESLEVLRSILNSLGLLQILHAVQLHWLHLTERTHKIAPWLKSSPWAEA